MFSNRMNRKAVKSAVNMGYCFSLIRIIRYGSITLSSQTLIQLLLQLVDLIPVFDFSRILREQFFVNLDGLVELALGRIDYMAFHFLPHRLLLTKKE